MEGKAHVVSFLKKCIDYANASIERKTARGEHDDISKWEAYRDFTAHAVMEVERGELDRWFPSQQNFIAGLEVATVDLSSLAHETRAAWLTNLASPRPLALIGTTSPHGLRNLAPYTSLSVVSNSPPLAIVSFSADRNERWRDTLINLRETKKAVLNFLPASETAATIVEQTAQPLNPQTSEWDEFSIAGVESHPLVMQDAAFAIFGEMIDEIDLMEANAKLVVLKLSEILVPGSYDGLEPAHLLCQHGLNKLMATPTEWHYNIDRSV
ncbi:MAG: flavin reductase [Candidatus Thermoplasmatota archaeon]|nr:flavin reductase [Candidatus Thermoplasmatota archaeon]MEC7254064.1 flavin reductase [Candidatus Thermoplasmatota archaeon]